MIASLDRQPGRKHHWSTDPARPSAQSAAGPGSEETLGKMELADHDDALVEKYASDLSSSGVTDVSNCLVFFNFTNSNEFNFRINFEADLWAKLAINDQLARALKDKITQYLQ